MLAPFLASALLIATNAAAADEKKSEPADKDKATAAAAAQPATTVLPATAPAAPASPPPTLTADPKYWEARIKTRSKARYDLLVAGKLEETYEFLSVATRKEIPRDRYIMLMSQTKVMSADVFDARCAADFCTSSAYVTVNLSIPRVPARGALTTQEFRWIVSEGEAWLLLR